MNTGKTVIRMVGRVARMASRMTRVSILRRADNAVYHIKRDFRKASEGRYIGDGRDTLAPTGVGVRLLMS